MKTWKRKNGSNPTYLALVQAFFKEDISIVEYIIEYVKKNVPIVQESLHPVENGLVENEHTCTHMHVEQKYLKCITNIAKSFNKCNIGVDKVKYALTTCCCIPDDEVVPVDSLQGLLAVVQRHCSWFNHQPLEMLLNNLECDKEKTMLSEYQNSVLEPYLAQPIFEIPFSSFGSEATSIEDDIIQPHLALVDMDLQLTAKEALVIRKKLAHFLLVPLLELVAYDAQKMHFVFAIPKVIYDCARQNSPLHRYIAYDSDCSSYIVKADITHIL